MAELPSVSSIMELLALFAPGLVILTIAARVGAGSKSDLQDRLIAYAVTSAVYYAVVAPAFHVPRGIQLPPWLWQILQYGVVPVLIGFLLAYAHQYGWMYSVGQRLKLKFVHHIPTAWDHRFSQVTDETFVLVSLDNGATVAGKTGPGSFASSNPDERDLYLSEVWDADSEPWQAVTPPRGLLLCGKDIRHIEFF